MLYFQLVGNKLNLNTQGWKTAERNLHFHLVFCGVIRATKTIMDKYKWYQDAGYVYCCYIEE